MALALTACSSDEARSPSSPPNIVLLIADDLGWADVSSERTTLGNGSRFHETPNIDRLAEEGMSFPAAYTLQNCAPTRASLLSGQYAPRHRVYHVQYLGDVPAAVRDRTRIMVPPQEYDLDPTTVSVAETLAAAGYRSALVGRVRGFGPIERLGPNHGFEINLGTPQAQWIQTDGGGMLLHYFAARGEDGRWRFPRPSHDRYAQPYTLEYVEDVLLPVANGNDPRALVGTPKHLTDANADAAIDIIAESVRDGRSLFLVVGFAAVHTPISPRPDLRAKYERRKSTDPRHSRADYAALVEGLDQSVGRIVAALDDPDGDGDESDSIREDTLVVFLSDNGGATGLTSNRPLRMGKGSFAEGGIRVPWIARMPGTIEAGSVSHEAVHVIDLYPTFAEFAGAPLPEPDSHPLDGTSLADLLKGETTRLDRIALYWHFPGYIDQRLEPSSVVSKRIGDRRYKLIYGYDDERYALYDLLADPGEKNDLLKGSPSDEHHEIARELSRNLRVWLYRVGAQRGLIRATRQAVLPPVLYGDEIGEAALGWAAPARCEPPRRCTLQRAPGD